MNFKTSHHELFLGKFFQQLHLFCTDQKKNEQRWKRLKLMSLERTENYANKRLSKSTAVLKKNQSNLMCEQETTSWPP